MWRALSCLLLWTASGLAPSLAADAAAVLTASKAGAAHTTNHPTWRELSAEQREALAPLAGDWEKLDANRKRKWLEIAAKYPNMSPEGKQRLHERMPQLARLTPEQRETARDNFRKAYSLPSDRRQALTQKYRDLPDERKRALAAQAGAQKSAANPRRPAKEPRAPVPFEAAR